MKKFHYAKKLLAGAAICSALLGGLYPALPAQACSDPAAKCAPSERAKHFVEKTIERGDSAFGYPVSQNLSLSGFYEGMKKAGLDKLMINNAGDPWDEHAQVNAIPAEREVLAFFADKYGFAKDNYWGIVTFSGTDGNNHGIYFGRRYLESETGQAPIVYVSKDAHYSNMRLCDLQQLEVRLIDADKEGRMLPEALEEALDPSRPVLIVFAMGTTFKGGIDNMQVLNQVIEKANPVAVYRHVDAALFGGYLPFTELKDYVNKQVQGYDSIAVSGHKFYGMDEPSGLFMTTRDVLARQKSFSISYLNADMPMINCSRSGLAPMKFWWMINHNGEELWTSQAKTMLADAQWLYDQMQALGYPTYLGEASNTVFFKRPSQAILDKYGLAMDYDDRLGGELAHICVMQHVTRDKLQGFIKDLKAEIGK